MQLIIDPSALVFPLDARNIKYAFSMKLIIFPLSIIFVAIFVHKYSFSMPLFIYIFDAIVCSWLITYTYVNFWGVFVWWNLKQIKYVLLYFLKLLLGQVCCGLGVGYENGVVDWCKSLEKTETHFKFIISSECCSQQNSSLNIFRMCVVLGWRKNSDVRFRK